MAVDTVEDVLGAVPGATPTSTHRTPADNRRVGGSPNSHHMRGTPENPRAVDLVPAPGETMAQLRDRVARSGVNTLELLNEGDHVHVAVDGVPRGDGRDAARGYRVQNVQDLTPTDTPETLRAAGYELDATTNRWFRTVGSDSWSGPIPLDEQYAERQGQREDQALDLEEADIHAAASMDDAVQAGIGISDATAGAVLRDVGKAVFQEGLGRIALYGAKKGFNATMDLTDEFGDWIENYVPGTVAWEGFDGDASTPARIYLTTQNRAQAQQEAAQDGQRSFWQRLGAGRIRAPIAEGEAPDSTTGRVIAGVTQFATGFVGGGRILRGWSAVGNGGRFGKSMVQGALADFTVFDGQEERLANLLAEHAPEALAPALNWLAADEDDGELEGRFKNAVEGLLIGPFVEVLGVGIRRLRAARQVRQAARDAAKAEGLQIDPTIPVREAEVAGEQAQAIIREALGDPEAPAFSTKVARQVANVDGTLRGTVEPDATARIRELTEVADGGGDVRSGRVAIGAVSPVAAAAAREHGVDIAGFSHTISSDDIRHIINSHGDAASEAARGQTAITRADLERLPELLADPDYIVTGLRGRKQGVHESSIAQIIRQDDGTALVIQQVAPRRGRLNVTTMWRMPAAARIDGIAANLSKYVRNAPQEMNVVDLRADANRLSGMARSLIAEGENTFDINLARIDTPDDVKNVITGMADVLRADVDLARRATRSHEQTLAASHRLDWVTSMAERRVGDAMNAEELTAYRSALNASATRLYELATAVKTASSTPAEATARQYALRRAASIHAAIQHEFMGARAEAGRALNAMRIRVGTPANSLRQIDDLLAGLGSKGVADGLADAILKARTDETALNQMLRNGWAAKTQDAVKLVYTNGLLSGVGTPIINVAGNAMMLGLNLTARSVAPRMARAFGGEGSTQIGEASALIHGYQQAMRDIFRLDPLDAARRIGDNAGEALRRDGLFRGMAPGIDDAAPAGIGLRSEREEAGALVANSRPLSAAFWRVDEDTALGRFLDVVHMVVGAPSNINALTDDFFKVIAARGELHAQAFRRVAAEGLDHEAARARYAALLEAPDDDMLKAAENEMHELTFTRETPGIASRFSGIRADMDSRGVIPWGTIVFPFIRTPANLISSGMRYSPLAPFMRRFSEDMAAGGARAETAKAQMAVGTALWSVWMGMAMDGQLTGRGPSNQAQREALMRQDPDGGVAFQPYSVLIGDRWYSFERMDPLASGMTLVADMAELMKNGDWNAASQQGFGEVISHAVMSIGQAFFDRTSLTSAIEWTSAMAGGSTGKAERALGRQAASMIPFSSAARMFRRGQDPYLRETASIVDAIRNATPGLSNDLPPQRDLWGNPRLYETGLGVTYDAIVPVQTREAGGSAIDQEILSHGISVSMPDRALTVMQQRVSLKNRPDIYSEFVEEAGLPAFEKLNAVVTGNHPDSEYYFSLSDGPEGGKADYILQQIESYRSDARAIIMDRYAADLQSMAAETIRRRDEVRLDQ